jgi:hypothetical protein
MQDRWLMLGSMTALLAAAAALVFGWPWFISAAVVLGINIYLVLALVEVAKHSDGSHKKWLVLPHHRTSILLQLVLQMAAIVIAFGALYIQTEGVVHVVADVTPGTDKEDKAQNNRREVLVNPIDACYFSLVTFTTLGYGDYVPATRLARGVVMWQLGSAFLLLLVALPLLVSRLAMFK